MAFCQVSKYASQLNKIVFTCIKLLLANAPPPMLEPVLYKKVINFRKECLISSVFCVDRSFST